MMYLGGIEAGGKNFICTVGDGRGNIFAREKIATRDPRATINHVTQFFKNFKIAAVGIGSFGSIDLNPESPAYGSITATPKLAWINYPLYQEIRHALALPVGMTTAANAAALGELTKGAAKGLDGCLYITVGNGIDAGLITDRHFLYGLTHPEMGHVLLRRHPKDKFTGICPYHQDCLEGLASGPAIEARWGMSTQELPTAHPAWKIEAEYLAQALMQYALIISPKRIIIGGSVMEHGELFPLVRRRLQELLSGYIDLAELKEQIDNYVVPSALGDQAAITGALILARQTLEKKSMQGSEA